MAKRDYYEVLGVAREATVEEVKLSYKKLARKYHPDVADDKADAEVRFREINEAYSVLSDQEKRAHYDRFGHVDPGAGASSYGGGGAGFGFDIEDIFESMFGMGRGQRGGGPNRAQRGSDIEHTLELTLEEVFSGVERELSVSSYQECSTCHGSRSKPGTKVETCVTCHGQGQVRQVSRVSFAQMSRIIPCPSCGGQGRIIIDPCEDCKGQGTIMRKKRVQVKVPPGVEEGQYIRMGGQGHAGSNGGPAGDLYVVLSIKPHDVFQRDGDDLSVQHKITFTEAALGASVDVPTLEGPVSIKVPSGTQSHTTFKLRGKGLANPRTLARGDLHVQVLVMVPTQLNDKQKNLLREYAGAGSEEAQGSHEKSWFGRIMDAILP